MCRSSPVGVTRTSYTTFSLLLVLEAPQHLPPHAKNIFTTALTQLDYLSLQVLGIPLYLLYLVPPPSSSYAFFHSMLT